MALKSGSIIRVNEFLSVDDYIESPNRQFFAVMQGDGNFVVYKGTREKQQGAVWSTNKYGTQGKFFAILQNDGNFVVYKGTSPQDQQEWWWDTKKAGTQGKFFAILQNDGNFVVYKGTWPQDQQTANVWWSANAFDPTCGLSNWMKTKWESIKDTPLWQIAIPGSHDSLSLDGAAEELVRGNERSAAQGLRISGRISSGQKPGIGQNELSIGQLEMGFRHFDLRFVWSIGKQKFYGYHGTDWFPYGQDFDEVFNNFKDFLDKNPYEIVILRLLFDPRGADMDAAIENLTNILGKDRIAGKSFVSQYSATPAGCTPAQLLAGKKQVIILWNGGDFYGHDHDDLLWNGQSAFQITQPENHGETKEIDELIAGRTRDLDWWEKNYYKIQSSLGDLSPYWWGLGVHTTRTFDGGLKLGAEQSLPKIIEKITTTWKGRPWNLVGADIFTESQYRDFANAVIDLNGRFQYKPLPVRVFLTPPATNNLRGSWREVALTHERQPLTGIEVLWEKGRYDYGITDARVYYGNDQASIWTASNKSVDSKSFKYFNRKDPIIKVIVKEWDEHGVIDLQVITMSGHKSWIVNHPAEGSRSQTIEIPSNYVMVGLQGREEGGYGLINLRLVYRKSE